MIRINLLPLTERQPKWPVNRLLLIIGCLMLTLFSSIYALNSLKIQNIESDLHLVQNQYKLLQPTQAVITSVNHNQQLINRKNNILFALTKERQSLYGIIQYLITVTPPQIWFTEIVKTDKGIIQLKGWSDTYPLVAEFMQIIESDQRFIEPVLLNVEKDTATQMTTFEILVKTKGI